MKRATSPGGSKESSKSSPRSGGKRTPTEPDPSSAKTWQDALAVFGQKMLMFHLDMDRGVKGVLLSASPEVLVVRREPKGRERVGRVAVLNPAWVMMVREV